MIVIVLLFIFSVILFFLGLRFSAIFFKSKEIIQFTLVEDENIFQINTDGKYSVCIVGGGSIENFNITIKSIENGNLLETKETFFKARFMKNGGVGTVFYDFYVAEVGDYSLKVECINNLSVKTSMLKSISSIEKRKAINEISILIKEYSSPYHFILGLVFSIIGLMILLLDTSFYLYKLGVIVPTH
ncbi:hypothetical protein [Flavobacterium sp.]|uniref:hypothetical protein n=1 Tax=Flavobacterium sp. TaxID=239 RepID=UPI0037505A48